MEFEWSVTPMGAPRMNRSDAWKQRPVVLRYRKFRDTINDLMPESWKTQLHLLDTLIVEFYLPMPKSWSVKKINEMAGKIHQQKPDIDNLTKALLDALFRGGDDCKVSKLRVEKRWSYPHDKIGRIKMSI